MFSLEGFYVCIVYECYIAYPQQALKRGIKSPLSGEARKSIMFLKVIAMEACVYVGDLTCKRGLSAPRPKINYFKDYFLSCLMLFLH